jgi:hypothetical protein
MPIYEEIVKSIGDALIIYKVATIRIKNISKIDLYILFSLLFQWDLLKLYLVY